MMEKLSLLWKGLLMGASWAGMLLYEVLYLFLNYVDQSAILPITIAILTYTIVVIGYAKLLQSRYNKLVDSPKPVSFKSQLKLEFHFSVIFPLVAPFYFVVVLFNTVKDKVWALIKRDDQSKEKKEEELPDAGALTASLGPSFMMSGFVVSILVVIAILIDVILSASAGLQVGYSFWEYTFFGRSLVLGGFLPINQHTSLLLIVSCFFFSILWWTSAPGFRLYFRDQIYQNQISQVKEYRGSK
ncbi:MAG: hypothetical protein VX278_16100, partial [Myxococcota bacterium]|nr:hypothetical protein [Myxococcota bacterium]